MDTGEENSTAELQPFDDESSALPLSYPRSPCYNVKKVQQYSNSNDYSVAKIVKNITW